jgi:hypothetical protein
MEKEASAMNNKDEAKKINEYVQLMKKWDVIE